MLNRPTMAMNKEKLLLGGLRRLLNGTARMTRRGAGRIGYYLLTSPRRLEEEPLGKAFVAEAEHEKVHLNGFDIQTYHWPGEGPKVLLLHGWESSTARWHALFPLLREAGYDIYALDAPAHGKSGGKKFNVFMYCQTLHAYFDHLGFAQDVWIGHSGGGMAAIYYNASEQFTYAPQRIVSLAVPGELEDFINTFCNYVGVNERVKFGIEHRFHRKLDFYFSDINFKEFVKQVRVPGLIIHDTEDEVAPVEGAHCMHANWKGSKLVVTRKLGHSLIGKFVPAVIVEYLRSELQPLEQKVSLK